MSSNLLDTTTETLLHDVFDAGAETILVANPAGETIEELIEVAVEYDGDLPSMRLLAESDVLKNVMGDFIVASNAADLVDGGDLQLGSASDLPANSLLVTDERVISLVVAGDGVAGLVGDDDAFVEAVGESYDDEWAGAEEFGLRTPPLSKVRETLESDIGPDTERDFEQVLASLETARGDGDGLDEVTISLLVAAKNEELLYDISKWGEDVGIASKATFSRTK
ncbi:MAG: DUF5821 family protein, partial [Halobacteriales archaeon]